MPVRPRWQRQRQVCPSLLAWACSGSLLWSIHDQRAPATPLSSSYSSPYFWISHRRALYGFVTAQMQPLQPLLLLAWPLKWLYSSSKPGPRYHGFYLRIAPMLARRSQISSTELCFGGLAHFFSLHISKISGSRTCMPSITVYCLNHWNIDSCIIGRVYVIQTSIYS